MIEEKILEELFGFKGELTGGTKDSFDFDIKRDNSMTIELEGNTARLYEWYSRGMKEKVSNKYLNEEQIKQLKAEGYIF